MERKIHLLIIDDSENSCRAILKTLREGGLNPIYHRAHTKKAIAQALQSAHWDIIISDFPMTESFGLSVPEVINLCNTNPPFILVGDHIPEKSAVTAMNNGANDCLEKKRLQCLVPIIKRELKRTKKPSKNDKSQNRKPPFTPIVQNYLNEVYIFDPQSLKCTYANPKALKSLGYSLKEISNLPLPVLYPDHTAISFSDLISPLITKERTKISACTWQKRKDGTPYPVELHIQEVDQQNSSLFSIISSDLTTRKEELSVFHHQRNKAHRYAQINKQQTELLANISHDLRTSLNAIILLSKTLAKDEDKLNDKQLDYANTINNSSNDLLELVEEVLDLSTLRSGEKKTLPESINVRSFCKKMEETFLPLAQEKNISLSHDISESSPKSIKTNRFCVKRILKNLLSNAIKFTHEGGVTINVYCPSDCELDGINIDPDRAIAFQVKDTGIGIPEDKQKRIFQRFQQADKSTQQEYGGTGLGLAICQKLTQKLGGTLQVQSAPGRGSLFTLYLPKQQSEKINNELGPVSIVDTKQDNEAEKYSLNGTVLLIDDCQMHNLALQEFLSHKIANCISVNTAEEAYQVLNKNYIDCLVLDMSLHDTNGHEIMTYLKTQKEYASIPIIVYTGKNMGGKEEKKLMQYADSVINKSVGSYNVLQDKILSILSESNQQNNAPTLP